MTPKEMLTSRGKGHFEIEIIRINLNRFVKSSFKSKCKRRVKDLNLRNMLTLETKGHLKHRTLKETRTCKGTFKIET